MRGYHPGSRGERYLFEQRCSKYGITPEDYAAQRERQRNACGICGEPAKSGRELHIDHDHVTGDVRGLLCPACNTALGLMRDNARRLRAAAEYLERNGSHAKDATGAMAPVALPVVYERRCKRCGFGKVTSEVTGGLCRRCLATARVTWKHHPDSLDVPEIARRLPPGDIHTDDLEYMRWIKTEQASERVKLKLGPDGCTCGRCDSDEAYCLDNAARSVER